mgnify:CR=1 FL=1
MILSKMQSYQDIFFLWKKIKTLFRNRICHKILKFSSKIRQIRDLQRRTTSKNQCECFFVFFVFRKNIYTQRVFWIFFSKKTKKTRKSLLNWSLAGLGASRRVRTCTKQTVRHICAYRQREKVFVLLGIVKRASYLVHVSKCLCSSVVGKVKELRIIWTKLAEILYLISALHGYSILANKLQIKANMPTGVVNTRGPVQ